LTGVEGDNMDEDEEKSPTFRRALRMPEFWLLLVTGLAGGFGVQCG
jgi:hypothetical protein